MALARRRLAEWLETSTTRQRAAAKLLRIHYTYFNQILKGRRTPGLDLAVRIEELTGIPAVSWASTRVGRTRSRELPNENRANVGRV